MSDPTIYATLMEKALPKEVNELIKDTLDTATDRLTGSTMRMLEATYIEGVRDGFQQGVAAEIARAALNPKEPT